MANGNCTICGTYGRLILGWCGKHHSRYLRNGDPLVTRRIKGDDEARFWSKVDKRGDDECWPWKPPPQKGGYGALRRGGKMVKAHVMSYELATDGPVPDGLEIDHLCHDPDACHGGVKCPHRRCVNPAHLKAVPHRENALRSGSPPAINAQKTKCPRGHELAGANLYVYPDGRRECRCQRGSRKAGTWLADSA